MPPAGLAGRVRDRGGMAAKRRIPPQVPVPCDVLRPHRRKTSHRRLGGRRRATLSSPASRLGQSGVVGRAQLAALGFSRRMRSSYRVSARRLIRIHRGVYAVGHEALTDRGRVIAALLAVGDGAVASHWTAAALWRLLPSMPPFVDVTLTDRRPRQREGIRIHHAKQPRNDHVTRASRSPRRARPSATSKAPTPTARPPRPSTSASSTARGAAGTSPPAPSSSASCCRPCRPPGCRGRWSTTASAATRSTSSGRTRSSPWRPTDGPATAIASRSSATARVTPTCRRRASRCSDSRGAR